MGAFTYLREKLTHRRHRIAASVTIIAFGGPALLLNWFVEKPPVVFLTVTDAAVDQGETVAATLRLTAPIAVNVVSTVVRYPTDRLTIASVSTSSSIIDLWVRSPHIRADRGEIEFVGGTTDEGGWVGEDGIIADITFTALTGGPLTLSTSAIVLAHDGKGTNTGAKTQNVDIIIQRLQETTQSTTSLPAETASSSGIPDAGSGGSGGTHLSGSEQRLLVRQDNAPGTDITGDGKTSLADLSALMPQLAGAYQPEADFNQDGTVSLKDVSIMLGALLR